MNIFEKAVRAKLRFSTPRGDMNVEDLWDLPLTSKNFIDLDSIAKRVSRNLKENSEESFVTPVKVANTHDDLRLEILKHIIAVKIAERDERASRAEKKIKRDRLLELLANKEDAALAELTPEQIKAQLAELDE